MFKKGSIVAVLLAVLIVSGCQSKDTQNQSSQSENKLNVMTTIAQIAEPLQQIGEGLIEVSSMMGPGVDPHVYQVTTGDIMKLEKSDVILYNGLNLEANMLEAFNKMSQSKTVLAVAEVIDDKQLLMDEEGAVDPHIWFNISLWKQAINAAVEEIVKLVPEHKEQLNRNKEAYFAELDQLQQYSEQRLSAIPESQRTLITAHDAFGYFGAAFNINVVGLQGLSTDAEMGLTDIENTIEMIKQHQVKAVFVESSVNPERMNAVIEGASKAGQKVALGGELFSDAMGAAGTVEGTYIGMYKHNVDTIATALLGEGE